MEIKDKNLFKWPIKTKPISYPWDRCWYCLFHRETGHNTSECIRLKEEIESIIQNGYLKEFVDRRRGTLPSTSKEKSLVKIQDPTREIRTISSGPVGGESSRKRKIQARQARVRLYDHTIYTATTNHKTPTLCFNALEAQVLHQPHNDALVITLVIANIRVHRILVDGGSSAYVLTLRTFDEMRIG
ncbi:uncharacterized protein LOC111017012 [Momordica charantia]|uniref:Uncharacterized protein LOC111017012 n=1 Tax=Momordica charantia TaxID=3673 RepID=A0A6J1D520_MOMCH|nr:uncharacterized protein LOC111017012 [Momordica charantia]